MKTGSLSLVAPFIAEALAQPQWQRLPVPLVLAGPLLAPGSLAAHGACARGRRGGHCHCACAHCLSCGSRLQVAGSSDGRQLRWPAALLAFLAA